MIWLKDSSQRLKDLSKKKLNLCNLILRVSLMKSPPNQNYFWSMKTKTTRFFKILKIMSNFLRGNTVTKTCQIFLFCQQFGSNDCVLEKSSRVYDNFVFFGIQCWKLLVEAWRRDLHTTQSVTTLPSQRTTEDATRWLTRRAWLTKSRWMSWNLQPHTWRNSRFKFVEFGRLKLDFTHFSVFLSHST